jgi:hypothetical protein
MLKWDGTTLYVPASNITGQIETAQIASGAVTSPFVNASINTALTITNPLYPPYNVGYVSDQTIMIATGSPLATVESTSTVSFYGYLDVYLPNGGFGGGDKQVRYKVSLWVTAGGAEVQISSVRLQTGAVIAGTDRFNYPINLVGQEKVTGTDTITQCYVRVEYIEFREIPYWGNAIIPAIQTASIVGNATMVSIKL